MEDDQGKVVKKLRYMFYVLAFVFGVLFTCSMYLMVISAFVDFGSCWMRYNTTTDGVLTTDATVTTKSLKLKATMNYKSILDEVSEPGKSKLVPDPAAYGQWLDAGNLPDANGFEIQVEGNVSLCESYLPDNNVQVSSVPGIRPKIPRVGSASYFALTFPANSSGWRNLAEVTGGDELRILVKEPVEPGNTTDIRSVTMTDSITRAISSPADCSGSVTANVSPICGRVSIYNGQYTGSCQQVPVYSCPEKVGCRDKLFNLETCFEKVNLEGARCKINKGFWCSGFNCPGDFDASISYIYNNVTSPMPEAYDPAGSRTFFYQTPSQRNNPVTARKAGDYLQNFSVDCNNASQRAALPSRASDYKFWMTHGEGMIYRFSDGQTEPVSFSSSQDSFTTLGKLMGPDGNYAPGYLVFSDVIAPANVPSGGSAMFQLSYINSGNSSANTGGYVLHIQHTKCKRTNGEYRSDTFDDRGKILYYILPAQYDLNNLPSDPGFDLSSYQKGFLDVRPDSNKTFITVNGAQQLETGEQKLWLKILNKPEDYRDSEGEYDIKFNTKQPVGLFTGKVLIPIFDKVDRIIESAGEVFFKNMTCYGKSSGRCTDFFLYIKALLTLYLSLFAFSFLMGRARLSQEEFIKHALKILVIAGLMNGSTFDFFHKYVFGSLMNFTDEIMANFGGYSNTNPFTFLDEALNRILLNKMTAFQMLALISGGLTGVFMFFMTFIGIYVFLLSAIQGIATYIFAKLILAFLFGIAPLFLTFMLFEPTRKFFQAWVNNVFRYTVEPVVVLLGLAVFSNLFILYLDNALGYSVCFKCAIPFKVPNILSYLVPGFPESFKDIYLFCLYWFGPWGVDSNLGIIGLNLPDIVGLSLVAFMNYTYVQFSSGLVSNLTSSVGPSASSMGAEAGTEAVNTAKSLASFVYKGAKYGAKNAYKNIIGEGREKFDPSKGISGSDSGADQDSSGGDSGAGDGVTKKLDTSMSPATPAAGAAPAATSPASSATPSPGSAPAAGTPSTSAQPAPAAASSSQPNPSSSGGSGSGPTGGAKP